MKRRLTAAGISILALGILFASCNTDADEELKYSIQINDQTASDTAPIPPEVELYVNNLEYNYDGIQVGDTGGYALILIADGDRRTPDGILNNAKYYGVTAELGAVKNRYVIGSYSSFTLHISKMKIGETEYTFPHQEEVCFGTPHFRMKDKFDEDEIYPSNFRKVEISDSVYSLKSVFTVDPAITGTPDSEGYDSRGLALDPYDFIKVEGKINQ